MISVSYLFEFRHDQESNAPMFAYSILHKGASPFIFPHCAEHTKTVWRGVKVDKIIPTSVLNKLNNIEGIEGTASCQGFTNKKSVPTYFIFRMSDNDEKHIIKVVANINKNKGYHSGYGVGNKRMFRIVVVADFSYDENPRAFKSWWMNLPNIIKKAL